MRKSVWISLKTFALNRFAWSSIYFSPLRTSINCWNRIKDWYNKWMAFVFLLETKFCEILPPHDILIFLIKFFNAYEFYFYQPQKEFVRAKKHCKTYLEVCEYGSFAWKKNLTYKIETFFSNIRFRWVTSRSFLG